MSNRKLLCESYEETAARINKQATLETIKVVAPMLLTGFFLKLFGVEDHTVVTVSLVLSAVVGFVLDVATTEDSGY